MSKRRKRQNSPTEEEIFPAKRSKSGEGESKPVLSTHNKDLQEMVKKRIKPKDIAEKLRKQHGYSKQQCNGKKVSDRISYLKKNGLITMPPTNTNDNLKPGSWQEIAEKIAEDIEDDDYESDDEEEEEKEIQEDPPQTVAAAPLKESTTATETTRHEVVMKVLEDLGIFYTQETSTDFHIMVRKLPGIKCAVAPVQYSGFQLQWTSDPPSDALLSKSSLPAREWGVHEVSSDVFIQSPRGLSTAVYSNLIPDEQHPQWLNIRLPWAKSLGDNKILEF